MNLTKSYGATTVLNDVSIDIGAGQLVALAGENGAGKSTLSKILSGAVVPDRGTISLGGEEMTFRSPRDALAVGVSYVPQELSYLTNMTVAENLLVGRWPHRWNVTTSRRIKNEAQRLVADLGISLDLDGRVADMATADLQLMELCKGLARDARLVILDEPTASLTRNETQTLFAVLRRLAERSVSVIIVSHRLDDIFEIADRIMVLRNGNLVGNKGVRDYDVRSLVTDMLGETAMLERAAAFATARSELSAARSADAVPALKVTGLSRQGRPTIHDLNLELYPGEVVGLFGQLGSGTSDVADFFGGRLPGFTGSLEVQGRSCPLFVTPRQSIRAGIRYIPPERKRDGLVLMMSISKNVMAIDRGRVARFGFVRGSEESRITERWRGELDIRYRSSSQPVSALSGGNQQKVLLASRLVSNPKILVLNEPTRGVDIGARAQIHQYLRSARAHGTAVLWATTDVEEVVSVSDRVLIFRDGRLVDELAGERKTQENALLSATQAGPTGDMDR